MRRQLILVFLVFTLAACSTGGRNERYQLKNYYTTGALDQGLKFLEESKYYKTENEKLLYLMEKGMFLHQKGDYEASNLVFDEAINLVKQNYTVSVSKKVEKSVLNDNYDKFYGEIYEQSMLYFYSSLNSLFLYNKTQDRNYLFKARASIVGWDSFLNSVREDRLGKSVYKKDLVLKIYGAKIHELVGTKEDQTIALNLYKEAEDVLYKNYNSYFSFNRKGFNFKENYDKLPSLKPSDVKKNYIDESELALELKKYLQDSVAIHSTKKVASINENKEKISILLQRELIAEKVADKTKISLDGLSNEPAIRFFAGRILGLIPDGSTTGDVYAGMATSGVAMKLFSFSFELPAIGYFKPYQTTKIVVKDLADNIILKKPIVLLNPMGEIAKEAIDESSAVTKARLGARLAGKHIAAIMASFATYKAMGGGTDKENPFARSAAILQYAAASRVIEETEKADTRYWSTLPNEIRLCDLELDPGEYKLELEIQNEITPIFISQIRIVKNNPEKIFVFRK